MQTVYELPEWASALLPKLQGIIQENCRTLLELTTFRGHGFIVRGFLNSDGRYGLTFREAGERVDYFDFVAFAI